MCRKARLAIPICVDIVEAILEGRQPVDLTLDKIAKHLPVDWDEQRRVLGFEI
jgi:hypothetical protein